MLAPCVGIQVAAAAAAAVVDRVNPMGADLSGGSAIIGLDELGYMLVYVGGEIYWWLIRLFVSHGCH